MNNYLNFVVKGFAIRQTLESNLPMKTEQRIYSNANGWKTVSDVSLGSIAQLVFLFGSKELLREEKLIGDVQKEYPSARIVGCSTAGEICQEVVLDSHIVCTAVWFEKTTFEITVEEIGTMSESFGIGEKLAGKLDRDGLIHIMVLSEGLNINGSELTKGINSLVGGRVSVTGGLAGDQDAFLETLIVHDRPGRKNLVMAIGFYGSSLRVGYGSLGGWDSFGVDREVTRSEGNILYEVDGQPALQLYKRYLGDHAANLPASALRFPLSLRQQGSDTSVVRTVLAVDESNGSMTFAGDIPQGEFIRLMKANNDRLIDGAHGAAEDSGQGLDIQGPALAILISCVGRKLVLKQRTDEELEAVREVLGPAITMAGFYSYGEISPIRPFEKNCELHNQTMTITIFKEL